MTKMVSPAIVIGLEHIGQKVLTCVKENVSDTHGRVPDTIRLLDFGSRGEHPEWATAAEHAEASDVTLGPKEFISPGGTIDDDESRLAKGAGQSPPFWRTADFLGLASGRPKATKAIRQAIVDVKSAAQVEEPLEIHIVCSLGGGTGSGMLIDIAHIARQVAEREAVPSNIRAWVLLQDISEGRINAQRVLPCVYAAMGELQHFMQVFDRQHPADHSDAEGGPRRIHDGSYESRLFDACYLIDFKRPCLSPDRTTPQRHILPTVAQLITALLDPETRSTLNAPYPTVGNGL